MDARAYLPATAQLTQSQSSRPYLSPEARSLSPTSTSYSTWSCDARSHESNPKGIRGWLFHIPGSKAFSSKSASEDLQTGLRGKGGSSGLEESFVSCFSIFVVLHTLEEGRAQCAVCSSIPASLHVCWSHISLSAVSWRSLCSASLLTVAI